MVVVLTYGQTLGCQGTGPDGRLLPKGNNIITRVEELIDPNTGKWDVELVKQTFWPQDVNCILAIPTHAELEDIRAWHYDPKEISVFAQHIRCTKLLNREEVGEGGKLSRRQHVGKTPVENNYGV
jgi:hypothetical protein